VISFCFDYFSLGSTGDPHFPPYHLSLQEAEAEIKQIVDFFKENYIDPVCVVGARSRGYLNSQADEAYVQGVENLIRKAFAADDAPAYVADGGAQVFDLQPICPGCAHGRSYLTVAGGGIRLWFGAARILISQWLQILNPTVAGIWEEAVILSQPGSFAYTADGPAGQLVLDGGDLDESIKEGSAYEIKVRDGALAVEPIGVPGAATAFCEDDPAYRLVQNSQFNLNGRNCLAGRIYALRHEQVIEGLWSEVSPVIRKLSDSRKVSRAAVLGSGPRLTESLVLLRAFPAIEEVKALDFLNENVISLAGELQALSRSDPAEAQRISIYQADMRSLPFADESFDLVIAIQSLSPEVQGKWLGQAWSEAERVISVGGAGIVFVPDSYDPLRGIRHADYGQPYLAADGSISVRHVAVPGAEGNLYLWQRSAGKDGGDEEAFWTTLKHLLLRIGDPGLDPRLAPETSDDALEALAASREQLISFNGIAAGRIALVVEADYQERIRIARIFKEIGFTVVTAHDQQQARRDFGSVFAQEAPWLAINGTALRASAVAVYRLPDYLQGKYSLDIRDYGAVSTIVLPAQSLIIGSQTAAASLRRGLNFSFLIGGQPDAFTYDQFLIAIERWVSDASLRMYAADPQNPHREENEGFAFLAKQALRNSWDAIVAYFDPELRFAVPHGYQGQIEMIIRLVSDDSAEKITIVTVDNGAGLDAPGSDYKRMVKYSGMFDLYCGGSGEGIRMTRKIISEAWEETEFKGLPEGYFSRPDAKDDDNSQPGEKTGLFDQLPMEGQRAISLDGKTSAIVLFPANV
jgi:hypothetical protein